jgi:hypothetical protein
MRPRLLVLPVLLCAVLFAACDFPADPPLRSAPPPYQGPDTTKYLLPLKAGNWWSYRAHPRMRPQQPARMVPAAPIRWGDTTLYEIEYYYDDPGPAPTSYLAFPSLLLNTKRGLNFYLKQDFEDTLVLSHRPLFIFTFPYPAEQGAIWRGTNEYAVQLVSRDSLVYDPVTDMNISVYRYDVFFQNQDFGTFLIVPGVAILRIEERNVEFQTLSWRVQ